MPYDERLVAPMRSELTRLGVKELRSVSEVDAVLGDPKGSQLVFINSVCGCAAGSARPGLTRALAHPRRPAEVYTVFAGQDLEATARARSYFAEYQPSSPSVALLQDGEVVYFLHRHQIEGRGPDSIASELTQAFDRFCPAESR
jgi:putative YphP/YqiW family bacilliredoxin